MFLRMIESVKMFPTGCKNVKKLNCCHKIRRFSSVGDVSKCLFDEELRPVIRCDMGILDNQMSVSLEGKGPRAPFTFYNASCFDSMKCDFMLKRDCVEYNCLVRINLLHGCKITNSDVDLSDDRKKLHVVMGLKGRLLADRDIDVTDYKVLLSGCYYPINIEELNDAHTVIQVGASLVVQVIKSNFLGTETQIVVVPDDNTDVAVLLLLSIILIYWRPKHLFQSMIIPRFLCWVKEELGFFDQLRIMYIRTEIESFFLYCQHLESKEIYTVSCDDKEMLGDLEEIFSLDAKTGYILVPQKPNILYKVYVKKRIPWKMEPFKEAIQASTDTTRAT